MSEPRIERQQGIYRDLTLIHFGPPGYRLTLVVRQAGLTVETTVDGNFAGPGGMLPWETLDALRAEVQDAAS